MAALTDRHNGSPSRVGLSTPGEAGMFSDGETVNERELHKHFMDVESSFLPDVNHIQTLHSHDAGVGERDGVDDTYLELVRPSIDAEARNSVRHNDGDDEATDSSAIALQSAESFSSSPSAAAAFRHHIQTRSPDSDMKRPDSQDTARPHSSGAAQWNMDIRSRKPSNELPPSSLVDPPPLLRPSRPGLLGLRQVSHHSILSSSTMDSSVTSSEMADNTDFALQTGGAASTMPKNSDERRARILARMPSLGSLASYTEGGASDSALPTTTSLARKSLSSRQMSNTLYQSTSGERPETPRENNRPVSAPTDTVLAQRVESIHVPETIARDFRAKTRPMSPEKRPTSSGVTSGQDRNHRSLTLREQNAKIDKLTKENFDLKLKIHFLDQALQSRSDDGIKELIDKNVQFQTDLANERRESQNLRRKMRDLERRLQDQVKLASDGPREITSSPMGTHQLLDEDMQARIAELQTQLHNAETQVINLRTELANRHLHEHGSIKSERDATDGRRIHGGDGDRTPGVSQDLLDAEMDRRQQAEEDLRRLRGEIAKLRTERSQTFKTHSTQLTQRSSRGRLGLTSTDDTSADDATLPPDSQTALTLVEKLKRENTDLRRDLSAQTSMLTSRNRERERLQQEIEDLKLLQRKSDGARSIAGDSIFDRSISRAHQRAPSRVSDATHTTSVTEVERDEWAYKEGQLRDQNAEMRLKYQELERAHATHLEYVAALESDFREMEAELEENSNDLRGLQAERDDVLQAYEEKENQCQRLEQQAVSEIDKLIREIEKLEVQAQEADTIIQQSQIKFDHVSDAYKGLQSELREITQSVMSLEDEKQANLRSRQILDGQIAEAEQEISSLEQKCREAEDKIRKHEVVQESLQAEIAFLREEQEGDKIRIGELEDALNAAQQTIQDEQDKARDAIDNLIEERRQRDVLENRSKEELQKVLDSLNSDLTKTKDDVRNTRKLLSSRELEVSTWNQKFDQLETDLRAVLGLPTGSTRDLLTEIEKIQQELEEKMNQLDRARIDLSDRDRLLRHRDGLLESTSLESRRLSDLLDKERASRKRDLDQFEKSARGQATHLRQAAQQESRILDLETMHTQDKRKLAAQKVHHQEQLDDRHALLLALWNRLVTLCGSEWAHANALIDGEVPSVEIIARHLPIFNRNILTAVTTVESLMGNLKGRIRTIENDAKRDHQTLEHNLATRAQRIETLEKMVREAQRATEEAGSSSRHQTAFGSAKPTKSAEEIARLSREVKLLKTELKFHRQHPSPMAQQLFHQQNQGEVTHERRMSGSGISITKGATSPAKIFSKLLRHHSTSTIEQIHPSGRLDFNASSSTYQEYPPDHQISQPHDVEQPPATNQMVAQIEPSAVARSTAPQQSNDQRWIHRLKEMERRLKAERENRLLDRQAARQRIEEEQQRSSDLQQRLAREKDRKHFSGPGLAGAGSVRDAGHVDGADVDRGSHQHAGDDVGQADDGRRHDEGRGRSETLSNSQRESSVD